MKNIDEILKLLNALTEFPFESMEVSTQELIVKVSRGGITAIPAAAQSPAAGKEGTASEVQEEQRARAISVASFGRRA